MHRSTTIVDRDATPAEAVVLAAQVRDWLLDTRVVSPALVACVPDDGLGHPPGRGWRSVLPSEAGPLLSNTVNGVEVEAARRVAYPARQETVVRCPSCGADTSGDVWADAFEAWAAGDDTAALTCSACGATAGVADWDTAPAWGFGHLTVTFWNWPPLSARFLDDLAGRLGHRTVVVRGRVG